MGLDKINKVAVIGTSGCGKSTLGEYLSKKISGEFVDLDDYFWLPNWVPRDDKEFLSLIRDKLSADKWVVSGNYSRAKDEIWSQADIIIWLDLPLRTCLWRAIKRGVTRIISREVHCNGNYETFRRFIGRKSILLWILKTYGRRKTVYSECFADQRDSQKFIRLKSSREVDDYKADF